ncbi:MAG: DUF2914 domain-containing protein [Calothrix sp. SM1_5_4]|nr:DUF2914 domain-containing protein [Calothrix sp. SM1_5_4]
MERQSTGLAEAGFDPHQNHRRPRRRLSRLRHETKYQPGQWKVQIETSDGREIGRVYFTLEIAPEQPRTFQFDMM